MRKQGWVSPSGKIIECGPYEHLDSIFAHVDADIPAEVQEMVNSLEAIKQRSNDLIARGEHPEWHVWEMAYDSDKPVIMDLLFNAGWIRFGSRRNNLNQYTSVHLEGTKQALEKNRAYCTLVGKNLGYNDLQYKLVGQDKHDDLQEFTI